MTYCFYATMGGFTVDVSNLHNTWKQPILTADAIIELAQRGIFFDIATNSINDKSKADLLAKGLIICQVSWLVVQSIARAYAQLPLSLLEVHTMVHVVCAVIMYLLWWWKPKDVGSSTLVDVASYQATMAEMLVCNLDPVYLPFDPNQEYTVGDWPMDWKLGLKILYNALSISAGRSHDIEPPFIGIGSFHGKRKSSIIPSSEHPVILTTQAHPVYKGIKAAGEWELLLLKLCGTSTQEEVLSVEDARQQIPQATKPTLETPTNALCSDQFLRCGIGVVYVGVLPHQSDSDSDSDKTFVPEIRIRYQLSEKDVRRWELASASLLASPEIQNLSTGRLILKDSRMKKHFTDRISNFSLFDARYLFWEGLCLLGGIYGGVHLSVYTSHFPSIVEAKLWFYSCCILFIPVAIVFTLFILGLIILMPMVLYFIIQEALSARAKEFVKMWSERLTRTATRVGKPIWILVRSCPWISRVGRDILETVLPILSWSIIASLTASLTALLIVYPIARLYLVVESFISLRSVPLGVYASFDWTNYFPHL